MKLLLSAVMFSVTSSFVFADHHDSPATTAYEQKAASTRIDSYKAISVSGEISICDPAQCVHYFDINGDLFLSEHSYTFLGEDRYSRSQFTQPIRVKYEDGDNALELQIGKSKWTFTNLARSEYADHKYDIPSKSVRFFVKQDKYADGDNVTRLVAGSYLILHP